MTHNWTDFLTPFQDHEIFRLQDEIAATEGHDVTFYGTLNHQFILWFRRCRLSLLDFLGVKMSASQDDINKAFRKKSKLIHPDKVKQSLISVQAKATPDSSFSKRKRDQRGSLNKGPGESELRDAVRKASERFSRLGVVASILKGPGRERYDHFLNNGFPKWKGTGYYYARFRPGLLSVLVGLFVIFGGIVHYIAIYISWTRQRDFVERYVRQARKAAWGDDSIISGVSSIASQSGAPSPRIEETSISLNRRQKRHQDKENKKDKEKRSSRSTRGPNQKPPAEANQSSPHGSRKRVQAENGKLLIVDSLGQVFLEAENEHGETEECLLDPNEIPKPTISQTLVIRIPLWIFSKINTGLLKGWRRASLISIKNPSIKDE